MDYPFEESSRIEERLTFQQIKERLACHPYPRVYIPMVVAHEGGPKALELLKTKKIAYQDVSTPKDADFYLVLNIETAMVGKLEGFDTRTVYFQTPNT